MEATKSIDKDIEVNGINYDVELELSGLSTDEIICIQVDVHSVFSNEGDIITNREIINQIERSINPEEYSIEFSYEDFN
jgi:hypothetical protein